MKPLLLLGPLPPGLQADLESRWQLHRLWTEPDRAGFLTRSRGRFDGAVTMSRHGAAADVFECLGPRVVACFGTGFDGIDLAAAQRHGTQVSTTPDVLTECVADLAFGLVIASARRLVAADAFVRRGDWRKGAFPLATSVHGKRLGIVGLGRIGKAVAQRARGFGMTVRYQGRNAQADVPWGFEPDVSALAAWCDFLVLSCPGGAATHHLVDAAVLRALGPRGLLVNVARGSVVDEAALVEALAHDLVGGAGLDVFAREPEVPQALIDDERVVLLPHVSASTRETRASMEKLVVDNLESFFSTGRVLTPPVRHLPTSA